MSKLSPFETPGPLPADYLDYKNVRPDYLKVGGGASRAV